jgi:hypothetical protein
MSESLRLKWSSAVVLIGFAASVSAAIAQQTTRTTKPSLRLTIRAPKFPVRQAANVIIDVVAMNVSDHALQLENDYVGPNVEVTDRVTIIGENGLSAPRTRLGRAVISPTTSMTGKLVMVPVKPGMRFTYELDVSQLYDLSKPEKYTVQIERRDPDSKLPVKSNAITITVAR